MKSLFVKISIFAGFLFFLSCQSISTLDREHKLVSGSVYLSENAMHPEINHPVRFYKYSGEYFYQIEDIRLGESDTTLVASTFTGVNGRFAIALPTGDYYVLKSNYDGNESLTFFLHDRIIDDLNIYFQGGTTLINVIDTPPTRLIPTYGDPPRAN